MLTRRLRMLLPGALLLLIMLSVDAKAVLDTLQGASVAWLWLALLVVQLQIFASAWRWRYTLERLGQPLGQWRAVREYYLAALLNQILPGGVGGDAARIVRTRDTGGLGIASQGVLLERLAGQIALLLVTLFGLALWPLLAGSDLPDYGVHTVLLFAVLLMATGMLAWVIARCGPEAGRRFFAELGRALRHAWLRDGAWLRQGMASVLIVMSYLTVFILCAIALDEPLPVAAWLTVIPLTLLSMLLPVSIGGWGVRETTAALTWPLVGLSAEAGIATSVVYGLVSLAGSLPGALSINRA